MADSAPDTLRPEALEAIPICIIDADPQLARQLAHVLTTRSMVYVVGTYDGLPDPHLFDDLPPRVVIFDPELDDFRDTHEAIMSLRTLFGPDVVLVAHSDLWKVKCNRLRLDLIAADVLLGMRRHDYGAAVEMMTYIYGRLPIETLIERFGT